MMDTTTIEVTTGQREELDRYLNDGEPVRKAVGRLLGNSDGELWTEQEIRDIVKRELESEMREQRNLR